MLTDKRPDAERAFETPNNLRVEVTCDVCGNAVTAALRTWTDGVVTIEVIPCYKCMVAAHERGQKDGK